MINRFCALLLLLAVLAGCATTTQRGSEPYHQLTLTLRTVTTDRRFTFFELDRSGMLHFAGGRDAALRSAQPVGMLDDQQQMKLWELVTQHDLITGKNRPFASGDDVTYDVRIGLGEKGRIYRAIDDEVPGLDALHDMLMKMQAEMRYQHLPGIGG